MADVVIFGLRDFASLAHFYLRHDSPHRVVAFTVDRAFLPAEETFEGLPVVAVEELVVRFPPTQVNCFAPMSHRRMNGLRRETYTRLKSMGYALISYVSSQATRFPGTPIGENCFILEDNTIQPFVEIGDNVVLWSGNHVGHHSRIGDHAFITSHVVISGHCRIEPSCFLGVNATIRDGLTIGEGTFVGMGASITRDTAPWSVHKGQPARAAELSSLELES